MKICLSPGHGGSDPGACSAGLREKDLVLGIVLELKKRLEGEHEVVLTRDEDRDVSLGERCRISNTNKCDVFFSLHLNADPDPDLDGDPEAEGGELWVFKAAGSALAKAIEDKVSDLWPRWRGTRESQHLYELKHTQAPAALLEAGFIDSHEDRRLLQDPAWRERLLQALVDAFADLACSIDVCRR